MSYFDSYFATYGMKIAPEAYSALAAKLAEEKSDGRFYGIGTASKVCDELMYNKIINAESASDDTLLTITLADVESLAGDDLSEKKKTGAERLSELVSLEGVKAVVKEIVASVKLQRSVSPDSKKTMHMMFSGAPGTGKTVTARILGQILKEEHILSVGDFYEVSRKDLVGQFVGHTAPKTADVCRAAYGSVLFIDEAYTLDGGSNNDFGKEAISTLIAEMENKRDNFVVIFAGYDKELEKLFSLNPGLRDRIPYRIHFTNYSREELSRIFFRMIPSSFNITEGFRESAETFFTSLPDELMNDPNFSNARFVRNLVERIMSKAALRTQLDDERSAALTLTESDLELAVADAEFKKLNEKKRVMAKIGF
jgi:SpoVK/Ycf46/Vps4 family AAA+-type ATPase